VTDVISTKTITANDDSYSNVVYADFGRKARNSIGAERLALAA
jgi:hypothetical protein